MKREYKEALCTINRFNLFDRLFLWYLNKKMSKYNSKYRIQRRGRHPNRKNLFTVYGLSYCKNTQNDVPIELAKTWGIYLRDRKDEQRQRKEYKQWQETYNKQLEVSQ